MLASAHGSCLTIILNLTFHETATMVTFPCAAGRVAPSFFFFFFLFFFANLLPVCRSNRE